MDFIPDDIDQGLGSFTNKQCVIQSKHRAKVEGKKGDAIWFIGYQLCSKNSLKTPNDIAYVGWYSKWMKQKWEWKIKYLNAQLSILFKSQGILRQQNAPQIFVFSMLSALFATLFSLFFFPRWIVCFKAKNSQRHYAYRSFGLRDVKREIKMTE